jgi:hypothetical protein
MAVSTTQSIWRSGGGDQTRTAYCGTGLMVAQFYISGASAAGTTAKVSSASGAPAIILPANAVVVQINALCAATGGTTPTFDMGFTLYGGAGTATDTGLVSAAVATTGKLVIDFSSATAGASLGAVMSATQMVYITGGGTSGDAPTGGSITGQILYYVVDPLLGQQSA